MRTARTILLLVLLFSVDKCPQYVLGFGIGFSAQVNPTNAINIELSSKAVKEKIPTAIHSILGNFLTKPPNADSIKNVGLISVDNVVLNSPPTEHHVESTTSSSFEISPSSTTERRSEKTTESIGTSFGLHGIVSDSRPSIVMGGVISSTTETPIELNLGGFFMGSKLTKPNIVAELNVANGENVIKGSVGSTGQETGQKLNEIVLNAATSGTFGSSIVSHTQGGIGMTTEENLIKTFVDPHATKLEAIGLATGGKLNLKEENLVLNVSAKVPGIVLAPKVTGEVSVGTSYGSLVSQTAKGSEIANEENIIEGGIVSNIVSDIMDIVLGPKVTADVAVSTSGSDAWAANAENIGLESGAKMNVTQEGVALNIVSEAPGIVLGTKVTGVVSSSGTSGGSITPQTISEIGPGEKSNVTQAGVVINVASKLPRIVEEPDVIQQAIVSGASVLEEFELAVPSDTTMSVSGPVGAIAVQTMETAAVSTPSESVPSAASIGFGGSIVTEEAMIPNYEISSAAHIQATVPETVENANSIIEEQEHILPFHGVNMQLGTEGSAELSLVTPDVHSASESVQQLQEMAGAPDATATISSTGGDVATASVTGGESSSMVEGSLTYSGGKPISNKISLSSGTTAESETDLITASQTVEESNSNRETSESTLVNSDNRTTSAKSLLSSEAPVHEVIVPSHSVFPESHQTPEDLSPPILCTEAGNFSVAGNCHVYISCSAEAETFSRQVCDCPERTAFSPLVRRCTRDISPCESEQPACIKSGTIPDPSNSSLYFWCIPSLIGGFHKYHVQCSVIGCLPEEHLFTPNKLINSMPSDRDIAKSEWKQLKKEIKVLVKVEKIRQKMEAKAKARIDKLVADKLKKQKRPSKKDEDSDDDDDEDDE